MVIFNSYVSLPEGNPMNQPMVWTAVARSQASDSKSASLGGAGEKSPVDGQVLNQAVEALIFGQANNCYYPLEICYIAIENG